MKTIYTQGIERKYTSVAADKVCEFRRLVSKAVGTVFLGQLIQEMEKSIDVNNPLNGGRAARMFRTQLYNKFIEDISSSDQFRIGKAIADNWLRMYLKCGSEDGSGKGVYQGMDVDRRNYTSRSLAEGADIYG